MAVRGTGIGTGFGRLWAAVAAGSLGDGVCRVAIALFAAALTRDPVAVSLITALSYLPGLVLGLPIGVLVDRYDRRRLAVLAGGVRAASIGVLIVAVATDRASLWLLYLVVVLLHTGEAGYDNATTAMLPMIVADRDNLEQANGRLQGSRLVAEDFVGPALAGLVFALAAAFAFGVTVACFLAATVLLVLLPGTGRPGRRATGPSDHPPSLRRELLAGWRYLRGHRLQWALLVLMGTVFFGAAMVNATNVLWTLDVLGISEALFGVFVLTLAAGALVGSQTAATLARRAGRGRALWITLATASAGALTAAATTSPYVAGVGLFTIGWASVAFGIINLSLRQRLTPAPMLGRVTGTFRAVLLGAMVLGALTGGGLASAVGLRLPWLLLGLGLLIVSAVTARRLTNQVIDQALATADQDAAAPTRTSDSSRRS